MAPPALSAAASPYRAPGSARLSPRLRCPVGHRAADPPELIAAEDSLPDQLRITATVAEGHCAACPTFALRPEPLTLYGRSVSVGRCPCCAAAWRAAAGGWECLDRGRMIEG